MWTQGLGAHGFSHQRSPEVTLPQGHIRYYIQTKLRNAFSSRDRRQRTRGLKATQEAEVLYALKLRQITKGQRGEFVEQ
jgi:hypothetical protein